MMEEFARETDHCLRLQAMHRADGASGLAEGPTGVSACPVKYSGHPPDNLNTEVEPSP